MAKTKESEVVGEKPVKKSEVVGEKPVKKSEVLKEKPIAQKSEVLEENTTARKKELPSDDDAKPKAPASEKIEGVDPSGSDTPGPPADDAKPKPPVSDKPVPAAAAYRWHVVVILISLAFAWSKYGQEGWDLKSLYNNWGKFHSAWAAQFVVASLPVALTWHAFGPIQDWCADIWFGLLARSALINIPVSWVLAYLYCKPFLFQTTCNLERYDSVMALGTLFWAVILTQLSTLFWGMIVNNNK